MATYYHGRLWDAPLTDDALPASDKFLATFLGKPCDWCKESMNVDDDLLFLPYMATHLECNIRSVVGDVQHLEGRCLCFRGTGNEITYETDEYPTYREGAKAALQWLIANNRGRFIP